jgi:hypothetical protein
MEIIKITRGGKFDQSIIYVCMETSQWNPLVQLIYANKKRRKKIENQELGAWLNWYSAHLVSAKP